MSSYKLTLINEEQKLNQTIDIPEGMCILDAANEAEIRLPFLCRTGDCSSCTCKLLSGTVTHTGQTMLNETRLAEGFVLACSAYATSDIVIETNKEKELRKLTKAGL
jgi:ferredoxin